MMTRGILRATALAGLLCSATGLLDGLTAAVPTAGAYTTASQGGVTMEWLGWMFFRFTSPRGTVVLTSPWLENPDSPTTLDELGRVDLVLVPNGHPDDQGQALQIG